MASSPWTALRRRMPLVHQRWDWAIEDLSLDQVNHQEREGVLPLAFSFLHLVTTEDRWISERLLGETRLWETGDWETRIGGNLPPVRRGAPIEVAETVRIGDLTAWREYQSAVFARTEAGLAAVEDERFDEVVFEKGPPDPSGRGFVSAFAGDGPLGLGDLLEIVVYQHAMRHLGEVEHARALVGLTGLD